MLTFFLTIIIVYVLWLVVRPLVVNYARRKFAQKMNDAFRRQFEQAMGMDSGASRPKQQAPRAKRKVFTREDGEYIEFEEIERTAVTEEYTSFDPSHTPREPQVSDADWEEIK